MQALDGNAIAGPLFEYFGREMTTARGRCRHCGTHALVAEAEVYAKAPGAVVRCRTCGNVLMVLVRTRAAATEVYADGVELLEST